MYTCTIPSGPALNYCTPLQYTFPMCVRVQDTHFKGFKAIIIMLAAQYAPRICTDMILYIIYISTYTWRIYSTHYPLLYIYNLIFVILRPSILYIYIYVHLRMYISYTYTRLHARHTSVWVCVCVSCRVCTHPTVTR